MKHLLLAKGLWDVAEGTRRTLAADANAQATEEFNRQSQQTFSTIVMAVKPSQLYLITSCVEPKEAWDNLKRHFRAEMEEGTKMETHLRQMKELTDRLAAIGAPVGEDDQVATLLGSLPEGYSTLVTALEAQVDDVQLDFVQQALINEEKKKLSSDSGSLEASAMAARNL